MTTQLEVYVNGHDLIVDVDMVEGNPSYVFGAWEDCSPSEGPEINKLLNIEMVHNKRTRKINFRKLNEKTIEYIETAVLDSYQDALKSDLKSEGYYD